MGQVVQAGDVGVTFGDSKSIGSNGPEMFGPLKQSVTAFYQRSSPPSAPTGIAASARVPAGVTTYDVGAPRWFNLSAAGRTSNDLVSLLATIYACNPHWVIIAIETNDADPAASVSNATWVSNINIAVAGIRANCPRLRGNGIIWVQATCFGELRPFGSNANDTTATGLGAKDENLRARGLALSFPVVELRTDSTAVGGGNGPWLTAEIAGNPTNQPFGYLTSDGRHDLAAGAQLVSSLTLAQLTLT